MSDNARPASTTRRVVNDPLVRRIRIDYHQLKDTLEEGVNDEITLEATRKKVERLMKRMNGPQELRHADIASTILGELVEDLELPCPRDDCRFSLLVFVPATTANRQLFDQLRTVYCTKCCDIGSYPYLTYSQNQPVSIGEANATTESEEEGLDSDDTPESEEPGSDAKEMQEIREIDTGSKGESKATPDPSTSPNSRVEHPKLEASNAFTKEATETSTPQPASNKTSKTDTIHSRESLPDIILNPPANDSVAPAQTTTHLDTHTDSSIGPTIDGSRTNLKSGLTSRTVAATVRHHYEEDKDEDEDEGPEAQRIRHAEADARLKERGEKCLAKEEADGRKSLD